MRYVKKWIGDSEYEFLEVVVYDVEDMKELSKFTHAKNVIVSLDFIEFLDNFTQIEKLIITPGQLSVGVYNVLKKMTSLKSLKIDYEEDKPLSDWCIDLSVFPALEYVFSRSSYNFCNIPSSLRTLIVMKWYDVDLSLLYNSSIDSLCVWGGKLKTLKGIEHTPIQILSLGNLRYLKDISHIEMMPLKILEIDSCNQIISLENLSSDTLEYLMVYGKNKVQKGSFVKNFKNLKRIILDIFIEDGDLSSFDSLEQAVILTDKRAFNRNNAQLPKASYGYMLKNIPEWRYIYYNRNI